MEFLSYFMFYVAAFSSHKKKKGRILLWQMVWGSANVSYFFTEDKVLEDSVQR